MEEKIVYRQAVLADMPTIAKIHLACFPDYFLSRFGKELIQEYYSYFWKETPLFVVAAARNGEDIIGFCMGYLQGSKAKKQFEKNFRRELFKTELGLCLRLNRVAISKALAKIKSSFRVSPRGGRSADLLSICVLPDYREYGVSENMLHSFEALLDHEGVIR